MKKMLKFLTGLPLLISIFMLPLLSDQVVLHYRLVGNYESFGSKYHLLFLPVIVLIIGTVLEAATARATKQPTEEVPVLRILILLVLNGMSVTAVYVAGTGVQDLYQLPAGKNHLLFVFVSSVFIFLGLLLPYLPVVTGGRNKEAWSLSRYTMVKESRKYESYAFSTLGIIGLILGGLPVSNQLRWLLLFTLLLTISGITVGCVLTIRRRLFRAHERS